MALALLDRQERSWLWNLFPYRPSREAGVFRTHPDNTERIQRLLALEPAQPVLHASWPPALARCRRMHYTGSAERIAPV